jgi:hypothetical protein
MHLNMCCWNMQGFEVGGGAATSLANAGLVSTFCMAAHVCTMATNHLGAWSSGEVKVCYLVLCEKQVAGLVV